MRRALAIILIALFLLGACTIPITIGGGGGGGSQKQSQNQEQRQSNEQTNAQDSAQQSSHASESRQRTESMPIILICNTNNSPGSRCVTPAEGNPLLRSISGKVAQ